MKTLSIITLLFLCTACANMESKPVNSDPRVEAEKLLNIAGMQNALEESMDQMIALQIQQNPSLLPYQQVMKTFLNKHMSYASMKTELIDIYAETFTAEELREINAFYLTDTGKKTIEKLPELMAKGGQIGVQRVQQNAAELESMIQAEAARLAQEKTQAEKK